MNSTDSGTRPLSMCWSPSLFRRWELQLPRYRREKRGLQPGISPLCGTATPGCAPLSAPGVHRDSVLAAPSPTRHLPSRMVLRDEAVGLRRETASSPRFMRRNLSSLRALGGFSTAQTSARKLTMKWGLTQNQPIIRRERVSDGKKKVWKYSNP